MTALVVAEHDNAALNPATLNAIAAAQAIGGDVDVLVELPEQTDLDLFDWIDMQEELQELLGRDVDLVEKSTIRNPYRRTSILDNIETLYASE